MVHIDPELEQMQDSQKDQGEELIETDSVLVHKFILSLDLNTLLLKLWGRTKNVFGWTYIATPELDPHLVKYQFNINEGTKPIKQAKRNFRLKLKEQIKQKILKLLDVGFIKSSKHPT